MKTLRIYIAFLIAIFLGVIACDPVEDESLRKKYYDNAGSPITKAELESIISVSQPIANSDDKVEGDQYVVLKNSNPKIAGVWHIQTAIGTDKTNTDNDTIIYTTNGTYKIYFEALSAHQTIQTDPVYVEVTNCFDPWETLLTGAQNKTDKEAKKTWEFWPSPNNQVVYFNGMYGNWKYYDINRIHEGLNSWDGGGTKYPAAGNYTMLFEFDGRKMTTYNPDGTVLKQGNYAFTDIMHTENMLGELITTVPLIGSQTSWAGVGTMNSFWLLQFDEEYMAVAHPDPNWVNGGDDWDYSSWYGFYKVKQ